MVQVLAERFSWTMAEVVVVVGVSAFPLKELAVAIGIDLLGSSVITSSLVVMASRGEIDPAFKMPLATCPPLSTTSSDLIKAKISSGHLCSLLLSLIVIQGT